MSASIASASLASACSCPRKAMMYHGQSTSETKLTFSCSPSALFVVALGNHEVAGMLKYHKGRDVPRAKP